MSRFRKKEINIEHRSSTLARYSARFAGCSHRDDFADRLHPAAFCRGPLSMRCTLGQWQRKRPSVFDRLNRAAGSAMESGFPACQSPVFTSHGDGVAAEVLIEGNGDMSGSNAEVAKKGPGAGKHRGALTTLFFAFQLAVTGNASILHVVARGVREPCVGSVTTLLLRACTGLHLSLEVCCRRGHSIVEPCASSADHG